MAQDVTIAGASYTDVPSITVPKTGGGSASFVDTTDADATASDILSGKTAYVNGTKLVGTGSSGVQTVNDIPPDGNGNVQITADDIETDNSQSIQDDLDDLATAIGNVVHVGASAPSDPTVKIWLDTDEQGVSAVSSVNGKNGVVVLDAEDVGAMAEWELLWENASPTSDFAAQTIQVDATSYDFYMIILKRAKDDSRNRIVEQIMPQGYGSLMVNLDSSAFAYRTVTVSTNPVGFSFEAGSKPQSYGSSSATTHNELMIPLQIWGIKGVTS